MAKRLLYLVFVSIFCGFSAHASELLNVSYDPTREFYEDYNALFATHWKETTGDTVEINQSHGGSGKQARAVIDGLQADVVTLALAYDIDAIAKNGKNLIAPDWQKQFPHHSAPFTSTIVFLVKKGNPKAIKDWDDLVKKDVQIITPNPKTSGGARWNYLAAYGYALKVNKGDQAKAKDFMVKLFANVPVLDAGARGATTTFAQRGIGDVLVTWESEAHLALREFGDDKFDIIMPSLSIRAEPPVAVVEGVAKRHKTEKLAKAYLDYLFSDEAQALGAKHFYRPTNKLALKAAGNMFPKVSMLTIKDFGGWAAAQKTHFDDGGLFDSISMQAMKNR